MVDGFGDIAAQLHMSVGQQWLEHKVAATGERTPHFAEWLDSPEGAAWCEGLEQRAAWCDWVMGLSQWHFWLTQTFVPPSGAWQDVGYNKVGRLTALKRIDAVRRLVSAKIGYELHVFAVAEPHQSGAYHVHGVVGGGHVPEHKWAEVMTTWQMVSDHLGLHREAPLAGSGALFYVTKYLSKETPDKVDWRFFPHETAG